MTSSSTRLDRYVSIAACGSGVVGFAASAVQADVYHYDTAVVMNLVNSSTWTSSLVEFNGDDGVGWSLYGYFNSSSSSIGWEAGGPLGDLQMENVEQGQVIDSGMGSDGDFLWCTREDGV